jgi:MFS family permease
MGQAKIWVLLLLVCLYFTFIYMPTPSWTAWMRDLVPVPERGRFFGRRTAIGSLTALASSVVVGLVLEAFARDPLPGFIILFGVAFVGSLSAAALMSFEYDPAGKGQGQASQSIASFSRQMLRTNYGRFVAFNFLLYFGTFILAPFVVPFMLNELSFSYLQLMVAISLVSLVKFLTMPLWGAMGDRYGSRKILVLSAALICLTPFTWLVARSFWVVCLVQVVGGFAWGGFEIAALSFAYDSMPAAAVTRQTSFLLLFRGAAVIGGGLVGGALLPHVRLLDSPSLGVFLVSGAFRVAFVFPMLFLMREERSVPAISYPGLTLKLLTVPLRAARRRARTGWAGMRRMMTGRRGGER